MEFGYGYTVTYTGFHVDEYLVCQLYGLFDIYNESNVKYTYWFKFGLCPRISLAVPLVCTEHTLARTCPMYHMMLKAVSKLIWNCSEGMAHNWR